MACLGLRSGGLAPARTRPENWFDMVRHGHLPNRVRVTRPRCPPVTAVRMTAVGCLPVKETKSTAAHRDEKFDRWMKDSVVEIVNNLREAPLFVHVYGGGPDTRLKTERAVVDEWSHMKGKWVKGEEPTPEGVILVEELKLDEGEIEVDGGNFNFEGQNGESSTKAWGVLIQGRGDDGGVACYLLKTSKAGGGNLGLFCTHYCLVRVKSFRETARSQLANCWLV